jgi:uncharacterized protein with HEPN domain
MFSERVRDWLEDIRSNVNDISQYLEDIDEAAFADSKLVRDAVERCLERLCEAVARIDRSGFPLDEHEPAIPWRDIRGLGNRLRHAYDTVEPERIWLIVRDELEPLLQAVNRLLAS